MGACIEFLTPNVGGADAAERGLLGGESGGGVARHSSAADPDEALSLLRRQDSEAAETSAIDEIRAEVADVERRTTRYDAELAQVNRQLRAAEPQLQQPQPAPPPASSSFLMAMTDEDDERVLADRRQSIDAIASSLVPKKAVKSKKRKVKKAKSTPPPEWFGNQREFGERGVEVKLDIAARARLFSAEIRSGSARAILDSGADRHPEDDHDDEDDDGVHKEEEEGEDHEGESICGACCPENAAAGGRPCARCDWPAMVVFENHTVRKTLYVVMALGGAVLALCFFLSAGCVGEGLVDHSGRQLAGVGVVLFWVP